MKRSLNYGRISWAYEDYVLEEHSAPTPLLTFSPIRIAGKLKYPSFSNKVILSLLKQKTLKTILFRDAYRRWYCEDYLSQRELGEGRAFLKWLKQHNYSIDWKPTDIKLHPFFLDENAPSHDLNDEFASGLSFALRPVTVSGRKVKLYLEDESVLELLAIAHGEEEDFLSLVEEYVKQRFLWESYRAPAPLFLEWVKVQAKRPIFKSGQLGFNLANF